MVDYKVILGSFLFGILFTACVKEDGISNEAWAERPTIQLTLSTDDLATRATTGESAFTATEKKMKTVDIYLFSNNATEGDTPLKWVPFTDKTHNEHVTISIPNESIDTFFGIANQCRVYAVVNVTAEEFEAAGVSHSSPTLAGLRKLKAKTESFAEKFDGFAMFTKDENGDKLKYDPEKRTAEDTVKVKNLASKIDMFVNFGDENETVMGVDPTGTLDGVRKWKIYKGSTDKPNEAYIINGVQTVPLNGWSGQDYTDGELTKGLNADDYFDTRSSETNHYLKASEEADKDKYPWVIAEPFYSYPNQWSNDALEQHQTYLMVKVNWLPYEIDEHAPNVEDEIVETYYKVPINVADGTTIKSKDKLLSNVYYRVKIHINTLGGTNYGEPVELTDCSWEVLPWGESRLDAEIHEIRYLEITQKQKDIYDGEIYNAVMNNTNSVTLSYNTTHSVYLKSVEIKYYNFDTADPYAPELVSVLAYKDINKYNNNRGKPSNYDDLANAGIDANVFTLTDDKLVWFEEQGEEPNGIYIDESNQTVTFYHSVYPLIGDNQSSGLPGEGKYYGVYKRNGDKTYSPYFIKFTLAHVDQPDFEKTYEIKQYPGVFLTFDENSGTTISETTGKLVPIGFRVSAGDYNATSQGRYGVYVNGGATGSWRTGSNSSWGDVPSNCLQLGGIGGTGLPNNTNMYVIHVNQLSDDETVNLSFYDGSTRDNNKVIKFHLGDPRTKYVNNYLENDGDLEDVEVTQGWTATDYSSNSSASRSAFKKVPAQTGRGNAQRWYHKEETSLRYYYPTAEGQLEEQAFMIAPTLRLSSGYTEVFEGRSHLSLVNDNRSSDNLTRSNARRRCAALQDNGYPAGRWRVPTIGELYFFKMLYKKAVLPDLFGNTRAYWSAQYLVKFSEDNADIRIYPANALPSHKFVRCVYDDWYWVKDDGVTPDVITIDNTTMYDTYSTDGDIREMFVWGDKEKNNPQVQPSGN